MKKIIKNSLKLSTLDELATLLLEGYPLMESLDLLETLERNQQITEMKYLLSQGYSFDEILCQFVKDRWFLDLYLCLSPVKGLGNALHEAYAFYLEKERFIQTLKKQLSYPMLLVLLMGFFSLFVSCYLMPQLMMLVASFQLSSTTSFALIQWIQWLPRSLILIVGILIFITFGVVYIINKQKQKYIYTLLHIPMVSSIIQTYYSLKFAFYLSKIASYFDNFYDAINYFYTTYQATDLKILLKEMISEINQGKELQQIILNCDFFSDGFKRYMHYILSSHQKLNQLNQYCDLMFSSINQSMTFFSKAVMAIIYGCTGIYVMVLYQLMMLPILEISNAL